MSQEEYDKLVVENGAHDLARPFWKGEDFHKTIWEHTSVTVVICQRKTKHITQMCVESLLRFYPNIEVLVVDGNSQDDSTLYLRYTALKYPNVKVWERHGNNSHGDSLHEAIMGHVKTEYVLTMDSDVVTMKHGMIEGMMNQLKMTPEMYATGTLMLVSRKNQSCGAPADSSDVLRYAHPCLSLYDVGLYKTLHPAYDHGAAFCENMADAERKGLMIGTFPVDKYSIHISGSSWQEIGSIYDNDNDVFMRPFVTFIASKPEHFTELQKQSDKDFEIIPIGNLINKTVSLHGIPNPHVTVSNRLYEIRFQVHGEYVVLLNESVTSLYSDIVHLIKHAVVEQGAPPSVDVGGLVVYDRKFWQRYPALQ